MRQLASIASILLGSVLAFGVAAMAAGMGVLFVLIGLGIRDVSSRVGAHA